MLTILLLCALALVVLCVVIPIGLFVFACAIEVLPLAIGLAVCWTLFHMVGCL